MEGQKSPRDELKCTDGYVWAKSRKMGFWFWPFHPEMKCLMGNENFSELLVQNNSIMEPDDGIFCS